MSSTLNPKGRDVEIIERPRLDQVTWWRVVAVIMDDTGCDFDHAAAALDWFQNVDSSEGLSVH
jgi:hypothetical protein